MAALRVCGQNEGSKIIHPKTRGRRGKFAKSFFDILPLLKQGDSCRVQRSVAAWLNHLGGFLLLTPYRRVHVNFTLDYWYKMMILISFILILIALTVPIQVISNGALLLIGLGGFMVGMGEWINHPYREHVGPFIKLTDRSRKNSLGGVITVLAGIFIMLAGVIGAARTYLV